MAMTAPSDRGESYNANVEQLRRWGKNVKDALLPGAEAANTAAMAYMNRNKQPNEEPATPEPEQQPPVAEQNFVDPNFVEQPVVVQQASPSPRQVASAPAQIPVEAPVSATTASPAPAQDDFMQAREKEISDAGAQEQKLHQERAAEIQKKLDEDEALADKIEPKDFFEGKNTWQKVLAGIGMFVGSITPEGARNVANIVEKEINRDLEAQKTNLKLKQDKSDKRFQLMIQKYGSEEAALLAKKKTAFDLLDSRLKRMEMATKSEEARSRIAMGREELALKRQELGVKTAEAMIKAQQEYSKGAVPGYVGTISDPTAARDFRSQVSNAKAAFSEIDNLLAINKKGISASFSPSDRASASQSQSLLLGQLREVLVGPGSMSEGDRELMEDAIANPTSFFTLKSSNDIKLNKLKQAIQRKVEANASAYGLKKQAPQGARVI